MSETMAPLCPRCTMRPCMEQTSDSWGPDYCAWCGPCTVSGLVEELCETRALVRWLYERVLHEDLPRHHYHERRSGISDYYTYRGSAYDSVQAAMAARLTPASRGELFRQITREDLA